MSRRHKEERAEWSGKKWIVCSVCAEEELQVGGDVKSIICPRCVQRMVDPPVLPGVKEAKETDGWPKGWWFKMRYDAPNGKVYSKGVEVTEAFFEEEKPAKKSKGSKARKTSVRGKQKATKKVAAKKTRTRR